MKLTEEDKKSLERQGAIVAKEPSLQKLSADITKAMEFLEDSVDQAKNMYKLEISVWPKEDIEDWPTFRFQYVKEIE